MYIQFKNAFLYSHQNITTKCSLVNICSYSKPVISNTNPCKNTNFRVYKDLLSAVQSALYPTETLEDTVECLHWNNDKELQWRIMRCRLGLRLFSLVVPQHPSSTCLSPLENYYFLIYSALLYTVRNLVKGQLQPKPGKGKFFCYVFIAVCEFI